MEILRVDAREPDPRALERAVAVLRAGGLVAFPTETVYGLGAHALDAAAVARIFEAKGRPTYNPLIAHVASAGLARELATEWPDVAARLAARFWPGPLSLVVARRAGVPDILTAGRPTVAVRVPSHPVALALLERAGLPVAAPSANRFTRVSPTTAAHVVRGLGDRVDLILDGGPTPLGIESTVIDVSGGAPVLLRPGSLPPRELEAVAGPLRTAVEVEGTAPRPSPGMVRKHYSPRARLRVFPPARREAMAAAAREARERGERVGGLLLHPLDVPLDLAVRMPADPAGYARRLYSALHELDDAGCDVILADAVPDASEWAGVRDRLARAAEGD